MPPIAQLKADRETIFAGVAMSAPDAVDGSSTGT
jgi:hypothetical protein